VIRLADDVATVSDKELRDRLLALAVRARLARRPVAVTADQSRRLSPVPHRWTTFSDKGPLR
jgi:hypothetical protein